MDMKSWIDKWATIFPDPKGGFWERLGPDLKPLALPRRLVGQCRQVYVYATAMTDMNHHDHTALAESGYNYIIDKYLNKDVGAYAYSVNDDGSVEDGTLDLYAQTFIIMAFISVYHLTGSVDAKVRAKALLNVIQTKYRHPVAGFYESLDVNGKPEQKIRRQNPHMHFFEACMFAYSITKDDAYRDQAREILTLMDKYFVQPDNTLCEFLTDDLQPHIDHGKAIEPGHHLEWSRFLTEYPEFDLDSAKICGSLRDRLMAWVLENGFDDEFGGIYDVAKPNGTPIKDTKRIWCQFEAMAALYACGELERADRMMNTLKKYYIRADGLWAEHLNKDMSVNADYLPNTTPYHIYFPLRAALKTGGKL